MQVSIWYTPNERQPSKPGFYFGQCYVAMAEDETRWCYWNGRFWTRYEHESKSHEVRMRCWTEVDFDEMGAKGPSTPAAKAALEDLNKAIERYKLLTTLTEN